MELTNSDFLVPDIAFDYRIVDNLKAHLKGFYFTRGEEQKRIIDFDITANFKGNVYETNLVSEDLYGGMSGSPVFTNISDNVYIIGYLVSVHKVGDF